MNYKLRSASGQEARETTMTYQEIAQEREQISRLIKSLKDRKDRLDRIIKDYLKDHAEMYTIGISYQIQTATKLKYPLARMLSYFHRSEDSFKRCILEKGIIEKTKVEELIKMIPAGRKEKDKIKDDLDELAEKTIVERLVAKEIK